MTFTINTFLKTITIQSSFTYDQFVDFKKTLPAEWRDGYLFLVPIAHLDAILDDPKQITQPPYPLTTNGAGCYQPEPCTEGCVCHEN